MTFQSMLYSAPLYQPNNLPPQNSNVIILCSSDDLNNIKTEFDNFNIKLVISDKESKEELKKIFDYKNCYIVIFCSHFDYNSLLLLYHFNEILNELNIRHKYICIPLPRRTQYSHYYPNFLDNMDELEKIFDLLDDDESRKIFVSRTKSIISGNIGYVRQSEYDHYFHPKAIPQQGDIILNGGVSGDNISYELKFSKFIGDEGHLYSFEPAPLCYSQAKEQFKNIQNITLLPYGLWDKTEYLNITQASGGSTVIATKTENTVECQLTTIDDIISEYNIKKVDAIKFDIEGSEMKALCGGIKTITKYRPKLIISLYHKVNHIFEIPLFINELDLDYKFYMGHHSPIQWETVLYATPI